MVSDKIAIGYSELPLPGRKVSKYKSILQDTQIYFIIYTTIGLQQIFSV